MTPFSHEQSPCQVSRTPQHTTCAIQVEAMLATLQEWDVQPDVCCVLLTSTGPKVRQCLTRS